MAKSVSRSSVSLKLSNLDPFENSSPLSASVTDCAICEKDYTESLGFTCTACSKNERGFAVMFMFIGLFVLAGFSGLLYLVWPVDSSQVAVDDANSIGMKKSLKGVFHFLVKRSQSFKIIIVVWQIVTQVRVVMGRRCRSLTGCAPK